MVSIVNQTLLHGNLQMRCEALWLLGNIATIPEGADALVKCSLDTFTLIVGEFYQKTASLSTKCRLESSLCLCNILINATIDEVLHDKLIKSEFFSKVNEVLLSLTYR